MQRFDAIVLGAGGVGSAAAYYLAKAGQRVLLLEQFELDHRNGSSYGYSRVIRYSYDSPTYIGLMRAAYPLWYALQDEAKEPLYTRTGGLDFGFPEAPTFQKLKSSMDRAGLPYEELDTDDIRDRFPQFALDPGMRGLFQTETGMLAASNCVRAHTRLAQERGATLLDNTPVTNVVPLAHGVEVHTANEVFAGDRLVIAAGSWARELLSRLGVELPLRVMPCQLAFFQPDREAEFGLDRFPVFFAHTNGDYGEMPYGIATQNGSGVKVTTFYGWDTVSNPSEVDYTPSEAWVERLRGFIGQYLPHVNGPLVSTRRCLYTMTPDKDFVVDRLPEAPHVVFGAGFSGHGFKFTTLMGSILADLALAGSTPHDTSLFGVDRFAPLSRMAA